MHATFTCRKAPFIFYEEKEHPALSAELHSTFITTVLHHNDGASFFLQLKLLNTF